MRYTQVILGALLLCSVLSNYSGLRAERGVASYYHDKFQGRRMASGEKYHRDSFVCAHRRYPFGTWLRVSNPKNGKAVVVRVADRGPYSQRFTIDLSKAAARQLGIIAAGWAPVEIAQVHSREGGIVPFLMEEETPDSLEVELDFVPAFGGFFPEWKIDSIAD